MAGKGDKRRKPQVDDYELTLRWELMSSKTSKERKEEILKELKESKDKSQ